MQELANFNISIDRNLIADADKAFKAMGTTLPEGLTEFINNFLRHIIIHEKNYNEREEVVLAAVALFEKMRADIIKSGEFMTDDEINAEIQASRAERKAKKGIS